MTDLAAYEAVLRRPSPVPGIIRLLLVCLVVALLGWLGLPGYAADRYFDFQKSLVRSCLENGGSYAGGECQAPPPSKCAGLDFEPNPFGMPAKVPPL